MNNQLPQAGGGKILSPNKSPPDICFHSKVILARILCSNCVSISRQFAALLLFLILENSDKLLTLLQFVSAWFIQVIRSMQYSVSWDMFWQIWCDSVIFESSSQEIAEGKPKVASKQTNKDLKNRRIHLLISWFTISLREPEYICRSSCMIIDLILTSPSSKWSCTAPHFPPFC